ncbi:uncharacterized protein K452DRAFT_309894 [Aplosporella prunicola CBS 121167]|uniref:Uncharacterized protein n=1 Tax=Aplosporella prunicola CBS 121167 TaxID=1176127 RepID=A0A6A6B9A6_9PEZI|nr:uncharacterized protein K452DRAFT_309894 [Aplosporella prunicola CBS 121167]KAF2140799.1 hypothetical protein K452DRAFT_309894 [Aplosporella prunicola CBS 121167]
MAPTYTLLGLFHLLLTSCEAFSPSASPPSLEDFEIGTPELQNYFRPLQVITGDVEQDIKQPDSYTVYATTLNNSQPTYTVKTNCEDCEPKISKSLLDFLVAQFDKPDTPGPAPVDAVPDIQSVINRDSRSSYSSAKSQADRLHVHISTNAAGNASSAATGTGTGTDPNGAYVPYSGSAQNGLAHSKASAQRHQEQAQSLINNAAGILGYVVAGIDLPGSLAPLSTEAKASYLSEGKAAGAVACASIARGAAAEARSSAIYVFENSTSVRDKTDMQSFAYTSCESGFQPPKLRGRANIDVNAGLQKLSNDERGVSFGVVRPSGAYVEAHCGGIKSMDVDQRLHYKFIINGAFVRGDGFQGTIHGEKLDLFRAHCL